MFHRVTIIGNLGGDPESRTLESGATVCSFSVATNRKWTNSDGTQGEETVWFRISAWNRLGEICQQYLSRGRQVFIEGMLVPDRETGGPRLWTDQNGQTRASFEIRADNMKMLGSRDDNFATPTMGGQRESAPQRATAGGGRRSTTSAPRPAADDFDDEFGADEIPF